MRTEFLCVSVLRVASGPRVKLASCKSALNPPVVCSTDRSKAVVPVLVLLFVALWFILRGDLLYVFPCVILFLCFSVLLVLRLPRLGKRELISVLFVRCSVCACLDLSVSSSSWGLGRAAVCDCGTPWTFLLPFFHCSDRTVNALLFLSAILCYHLIPNLWASKKTACHLFFLWLFNCICSSFSLMLRTSCGYDCIRS